MQRYYYNYYFDQIDDEVFLRIPRFPEIVSSLPQSSFSSLGSDAIEAYALDAVLTALQTRIHGRQDIPRSDKFIQNAALPSVTLNVQQAMKMELYALYKNNTKSMAEFARQIGKHETAARRLLDLKHQSWSAEIENAITFFGKTLAHSWELRPATPRQRANLFVRASDPA